MANSGIASTIFEFLADPARISLELPYMTMGQRKSVRKMVQQHPELRCESFGFGEDRQLHLFKGDASDAKPERYANALDASPGLAAPSAINLNLGSLAKMFTRGQDKTRATSPDLSTFAPSEASSDYRKDSSSGGSPPANSQEGEFQGMLVESHHVRNTFIHIESGLVDERATQSMPRNMFRQCIFTESSQCATVHENHPVPCSQPELEPMVAGLGAQAQTSHFVPLRPGALVVVDGLVKAPAFNGCSGVVKGWDETTGRYNVLLPCASAPGGCQLTKVKTENLCAFFPSR